MQYLFLIFLGFAGFLLAFYIRHKKHSHETMVCPLNSDCDAVIYSQYSKFLGIPVEFLGLAYYGLISVSYGAFLAVPSLATPRAVFFILALTTSAFLFSMYLTAIQAFAIRQWCTWCLTSAGLCTLIFATALGSSHLGFIPLLAENRGIVLLMHAAFAALGVGGATITDIFFFKFLKDFRISEWEADVLHTISQVIWFALGVLVLTGAGLYLPETQELNQSPKFLVKMLAMLVIIVNGVFLNILIAPKLVKISFGEKHQHETGELSRIRRIAFALGAISITSWYSAFILGMLRDFTFGFWQILGAYIAVVLSAIILSQIVERLFAKEADTAG